MSNRQPKILTKKQLARIINKQTKTVNIMSNSTRIHVGSFFHFLQFPKTGFLVSVSTPFAFDFLKNENQIKETIVKEIKIDYSNLKGQHLMLLKFRTTRGQFFYVLRGYNSTSFQQFFNLVRHPFSFIF